MTEAPELVLRPAATVVLLREAPCGFEVLMMKRGAQLAFHGGAWVFPGGRVDPIDEEAGDLVASAQRAAVRETREESGLTLQPEALVPFSHWTTPHGLPRRFATWFFVAALDADRADLEVRVDGSEIHAYRWLSPGDALALQRAQSMELPPPTFVTLTALARFDRIADVLDHARRTPPGVFVPRPQAHAMGIVSLYAGDSAYPDGDLERAGPRHRLCMFRDGWRYELG
ncbi:MAG: NUDIX hydrolase [Myxococcales bacterium]